MHHLGLYNNPFINIALKSILSFVVFLSMSCSLVSGQHSRTLKVYDRFNNIPISRATCIVLNATDSSMILFGRTNTKGTITFNNVPAMDSLIFLILHHKYIEPGFANLKSFKDTFYMFPKNKVLSEVNIKTNKAITLSGDTIVYIADSFKLKENASVEDLLKKLPGIQVSKDGTIKAHGERVEKVLVDGDDFFGENASIATKNLDAKMIDRVEIIDAQSKKSRTTGVDDGEKMKVINLKLKESAKKGFFGKLEGGVSNTKKYIANGMINYFTDKIKSSSYLLSDNMNNQIGWNERNDFGVGNNWQYDDDLDVWLTNDGNFENDLGVIPRKIQGGAFYSQKFNDKKGKIAAKYGYRNKNINGTQIVNNKIIYEDKVQQTTQNNFVNADNSSHAVGMEFEKQIDSFQTVKINFQVNSAGSTYFSNSNSRADLDTFKINSNKFSTNSTTYRPTIDVDMNHELKFEKQGRFLGTTLAYNMMNNDIETTTNTNTVFFQSENDSFFSNNDYLLNTRLRNNSIKASMIYIEPLYQQNLFLELGLSGLMNFYTSGKNTFTKPFNTSNDYTIRIDSLSNNYDYNVNAYSEYAKLIYKKKKINVEIGVKLQESLLNQQTLNRKELKRDFINVLPFFKFDWKYKRNSNFKFNFRTSIKPPTIDQIQPFTNNTNPMYIVEGNKDLIPSTNYIFSLRNHFNQPIKGTSLWSSATVKFIQNDIVSSLNIASNGIRRQNYIQTNGNYSINGNIYYNFIVKSIDLEINSGFNFNYTKSNSYTNGIENLSKVYKYTPSIEFSKDFDSLVTIDLNFNLSYSISAINNNFLTKNNQLNYYIELNNEWKLPLDFSLDAGLEWQIFTASSSFSAPTSVALLSADIRRPIFNKTTEIKIGVYDILNQNKAINRSFWNNNIYESVSDALTRYVMVTLTYKFKNKEKKVEF